MYAFKLCIQKASEEFASIVPMLQSISSFCLLCHVNPMKCVWQYRKVFAFLCMKITINLLHFTFDCELTLTVLKLRGNCIELC